MNQRPGPGRKRKLHPDVASVLEASKRVRVKREARQTDHRAPHAAVGRPREKKAPAATPAKKPAKAPKPKRPKSPAQPAPQPAPAARHNGERARKRGRAPGILGLCDSFSSKCDLRGSKGTPAPPPGPNLRPKLPAFLATMAAMEEWPTARVQRVASLNAMAKVHILYENESRPVITEVDDSATEDCKALVSVGAPLLPSVLPPPTPVKRRVPPPAKSSRRVVEKADALAVSKKGEGTVVQPCRRPRKGEGIKGAPSSSSVAVSEYREVVHINTTKEMAVKDELREKEGVTHLYHYHTKATCLQMQTTYSGAPPTSPAPHPAVLGPQGYYAGPAYPPPLTGPAALMPPPPPPPVTTAPAAGYGVNHGMVVSVAPVHYGSALTVPHYGHAMPYAPAAEYVPGYYQPAGPLIQSSHGQCLIHKPVPYHPQHRPGPVSPSPAAYPPCPSPLCPQASSRCYSEHLPCSPPPQQGAGAAAPPTYPPYQPGPFHPQPSPFQQPQPQPPGNGGAVATQQPPSSADSGSSFQMAAASAAVPKSEPVTPPETKSPPQGNEFADASKGTETGKDATVDGTTAAFQPEAALSVVEPLAKKAPRAVEKPAKPPAAQRKVGRMLSSDNRTAERKAVKKNGQTRPPGEAEKAPPQPKNGVKKALPNLLSTVCLAEKRVAKTTEQQSPASAVEAPSPVCGASAVQQGQRKGVVVVVSNDVRDDVDAAVPPAPSKPRKENGTAQLVSTKKTPVPTKSSSVVVQTKAPVVLPPARLLLAKRPPRRKFAHGWSWDGEPFQKVVVMNNEDVPQYRVCFPAMRHVEGDVIRVRDCVLLRSGPRKIDLPFVAKVAALWENADDGEMMMSLLWYYRPEHTDQGRKSHHMEDEIFASKHRDANSVACIEDKCYVLTFAEYCRYRARTKMLEEGLRPPMAVVPDQEDGYCRKDRLPPGRMDPQMVFFCRRVYDFRQKRILKNPS
ncbi:bromo adjacent homology (BAH) domain-containing protein [Ixodes scapularis]|uniref:Bromo adjacent homology (BAH) domain-containing protein n=1 Tax=Ixodes scapularis TaxID=6945 RepID=B7P6R0_IXOSC|nr:bromo adjacent homology (BAH) domain-containing protein [Ixodes scapularis]|eukprot:XP_002409116.1 bromo adjacent homology (BAH) domain-containing protein [Ixodes scapularis]